MCSLYKGLTATRSAVVSGADLEKDVTAVMDGACIYNDFANLTTSLDDGPP